jgi:hypothetical protein
MFVDFGEMIAHQDEAIYLKVRTLLCVNVQQIPLGNFFFGILLWSFLAEPLVQGEVL